MKTKIIIASHGRFAEGIMDSLKMIAGEQDHVEPLCAYIDRSVDYSARIRQPVADHDYEKQALLVITDLLGGSGITNSRVLQRIIRFIWFPD